MTKTQRNSATGRMLIEPQRSSKPNQTAIKEAARDVARAQSKGMTAAVILHKLKTAR